MMKTHLFSRSCRRDNGGFSFVEMAIVLIIAGLLMVPIYGTIAQSIGLQNDTDKIEMIRAGLAEHVRVFGDYPCPADPGLGPEDADYGQGDCTAGGAIDSTTTLGAADNVLIGAVPVEDLAIAMDCGDRTGIDNRLQAIMRRSLEDIQTVFFDTAGTDDLEDTDIDDSGMMRSESNCLTREHIIDEHGQKFLYAVTEASTDISDNETVTDAVEFVDPTFTDPAMRQITVQNGSASNTANAVFIILSHGEDGRGAYLENGTFVSGCPATGTTRDAENCNGDNTFANYLYSTAGGATHFDDTVEFSIDSMLREEEYATLETGAEPLQGNMIFNQANNINAVVVGENQVPGAGQRLVVGGGNLDVQTGDIDVQTGNIQAGQNIQASQDVEADNVFEAPKFCYDPPMTVACCSAGDPPPCP